MEGFSQKADDIEAGLSDLEQDVCKAVNAMGELDEGLANLTQLVAPPSPPRALTRQNATAGRPSVGGKGVKRPAPFVPPRRVPRFSRVVIDEDGDEAYVPDLPAFFQHFDINTEQEIAICRAHARSIAAAQRAANQK